MRDITDLYGYQVRAANHQIANPHSFLCIDAGLGKTPITLTAFAHLQKHGVVRAALVTAPLRVAQSGWAKEARKWSHLKHLRFSLIHGTPTERFRAMMRPADVYLINYEGLTWLSTQLRHYYVRRGTLLPFDMLIMDESTKMKNVGTRRMEAFSGNPEEGREPILHYFTYRTALTGTPATRGLEDLFGQFLMVDGGKRLGTNKDTFMDTYFERGGYGGYKYSPTAQGEAYIHKAVSDIMLEMSAAEYATLPDQIVNDVWVELSHKHRKQYDEIELLLFTELDSGVELDIEHPTAKTTKCLQFSNGSVITNSETREWHKAHDEKLKALIDIVEESNGQPVLVGYNFKADAARIKEVIPYAVDMTGVSGSEFNKNLELWKSGKVRVMLGHPASMGHGVDELQQAGHIIAWFGCPWSLELYLQFNARLRRTGQKEPVIVHRILTRDTFDEVVTANLAHNEQTQDTLKKAVNDYRKRRGGM